MQLAKQSLQSQVPGMQSKGCPPNPVTPPGYTAAAAVFTFAAAVAVGNALWGNCNWGGGDVNINVNRYNNFNRTNIQNGNWQHQVEHRKGVQYRDPGSQQRYGRVQSTGAASREAFRGRADAGRQEMARVGGQPAQGDRAGHRAGDGRADRATDRAAGNDRGSGAGDRAAGSRDRAGVSDRSAGSGPADRSSRGPAAAGADRSAGGLQQTGTRQAGAFQGLGSGAQTRDFSSRGAQSRASGGARGGGRR
jgi:hypothetical protein